MPPVDISYPLNQVTTLPLPTVSHITHCRYFIYYYLWPHHHNVIWIYRCRCTDTKILFLHHYIITKASKEHSSVVQSKRHHYFTEFYTKIKCAQILKNTLHDHNYIIFKFTTVIKYISLCDLLLLHKSLVFTHFMNILSKFFAFLFLDPKLLCQAAQNPF